jgi:hypothetical protein
MREPTPNEISTRSLHGEAWIIEGPPNRPVMSEVYLLERFALTRERCLSLRLAQPNSSVRHLYGVEQIPYNGRGHYKDEFVVAPNMSCSVGENLAESEMLAFLWRYDRHPRFIHLGVESISDSSVHFRVQFSCLFTWILEADHPNPYYPFQPYESLDSILIRSPRPDVAEHPLIGTWTTDGPAGRFQIEVTAEDDRLSVNCRSLPVGVALPIENPPMWSENRIRFWTVYEGVEQQHDVWPDWESNRVRHEITTYQYGTHETTKK